MRRASDTVLSSTRALAAAALLAPSLPTGAAPAISPVDAACAHPIYLTIDTGHMGVAPLVADVLARQGVKATFFLANERTQPVGPRPEGSTLDDAWAPWWKQLAAQGHDFGSHTWDHVVWRADEAGGFRVQPTAGPRNGQRLHMAPADYCEQLAQPARRFAQMTGQPMRAMFRAPGGKTSPALLSVAQSCGWTHVPWTPNGFLGDELASDRFPERAFAGAGAEERAGRRYPAHAPGHLEPPGPVGAGRAGAAHRGPEGQRPVLRHLAHTSSICPDRHGASLRPADVR